jgi:hypothetical protein
LYLLFAALVLFLLVAVCCCVLVVLVGDCDEKSCNDFHFLQTNNEMMSLYLSASLACDMVWDRFEGVKEGMINAFKGQP